MKTPALRYVITSYVGVNAIRLGLRRHDVHNEIEMPTRTRKSRFFNESTDFWQDNGLQLTFSYAEEKLVEIALYPNLPHVEFRGIRLFEEPGADVMKTLRDMDNSYTEKVGVIIFPRLGIAVTGFMSEDDNQKSVTVFTQGRWESVP